jgi:hypothetical protein
VAEPIAKRALFPHDPSAASAENNLTTAHNGGRVDPASNALSPSGKPDYAHVHFARIFSHIIFI